jgi:hypothetical protein
MPILIPSAWSDTRPGIPFIWSCSVCLATFDGGPLRGNGLSSEQIGEINSQFENHCKQVHPALHTVTGISNAP